MISIGLSLSTPFVYPQDEPDAPTRLREVVLLMRSFIYSHGAKAKTRRAEAFEYLAFPRRTQREEAKRLGISERHFRRLLHEWRMSYKNEGKS
jgi:hypothetical protein